MGNLGCRMWIKFLSQEEAVAAYVGIFRSGGVVQYYPDQP